MSKLSPYAKAVAGFLGAAVVAYLGAQDGGVTSAEWIQILLAGLGGSGLVYFAPANKTRKLGERGDVNVVLLLVLATFVLVLLLFLGLHGHH